jgi:hypothetical protein
VWCYKTSRKDQNTLTNSLCFLVVRLIPLFYYFRKKKTEKPLYAYIYIYFFFLSLFQGHDSFFLKRQKSPPPKDYFFFVFDGKIVITLTKKNIQMILFLINFTMTNISLGKDIFIPISGLIIFFLTRIKFYLNCFNV